jgi:hypothetical protein
VRPEEAQGGLFDVDEVLAERRPGELGRAEKMLAQAIRVAAENGALIREDLGMIGAALVAARALDNAERIGGLKGGYLVAQLQTPYRETLQALRLPAEVAPAEVPRNPAGDPADAADWLSADYGVPE